MTKTLGPPGLSDVAKGMGMLGVVASHCLVETSLGILSDWYGFFMLAVFMSIQDGGMRCVTGRKGQAYPAGRWQEKGLYPWEFRMCATACCLFSSDIPGVAPAVYLPGTYVRHPLYGHIGGVRDTVVPSQYVHSGAAV